MEKVVKELLKDIEISIYSINLKRSLNQNEESMALAIVEYLKWKYPAKQEYEFIDYTGKEFPKTDIIE